MHPLSSSYSIPTPPTEASSSFAVRGVISLNSSPRKWLLSSDSNLRSLQSRVFPGSEWKDGRQDQFILLSSNNPLSRHNLAPPHSFWGEDASYGLPPFFSLSSIPRKNNIQPQTEKHQVKWYGPTMNVLDLQRSPSSKRRADQTGEGNIMSLRAIRSFIMRFAPSRPSPVRVSRYDFQSWIVVVVVVGAHKKEGERDKAQVEN